MFGGGAVGMLEVGAVIFGFHVDSVTPVPDVGGRMWRMTYEKNGAELVWLERPDEVKTFAIAFKTLPEDDTGVAHILEHSVLSGSKKYPVKSPFDEMRKSSLRVFMNAMTARDKTSYPFCTRNDQDFLNLADIYLDAVFHPNVVRDPMAFLQEGWHYDIDEKTGALSYNGVVYNEMKGVFADPERTAGREVLRYLYPDIVYGRDSGGRPDAIPHLTYEKFCAFYHKFYHPSNARILLDGSVDLPAVLSKLDSYLSVFDRAEKIAPIPFQPPVRNCATIPYPSSVCEKRTILVDAWNAGTFRDLDRQAALDVLVTYLVGSNEAPLKKALLARGLCDDLRLYWYDYQQLPMVLIVRNTTDDQAAHCRAVVRQTLEQLLKDGLDHKRLAAIINRNEFDEREVDTSRPRGLVFFSRAMRTWLYGGDPSAAFDLTGIYKRLRSGVSTGLFEKTLKEVFLGNPHHVELTYTPSATCGEEIAHRRTDELAKHRQAMTEQDFADLKGQLASLAEYQQRVDLQSAKDRIPALRVSDIPAHGQMLEHTISTNGTTTLVKTKPTSDGIVYASVHFPIDGLSKDELVKVPLLARLFGKLQTSEHDVWSLQTELMAKVGEMSFATVATKRGTFLVAKIAMLASENDVTAVELLKEILLKTRYDDVAAIAKVQRQKRLVAEREVVTRGDDLAECYAACGLARRWTVRDILHGYEQLRWLQQTKVDEAFVQSLAALAKKVFVDDGLVISITDNISAKAESMLCSIVPRGKDAMRAVAELECGERNLEGMRIDGDAGYSGTIAALPPGVGFTGSMRVAAKVLSLEYLHKEIREIGGAYGTALAIRPSGLVSCYTYRDPSPATSTKTIRKAGDWLQGFAQSNPSLDRYVIATIAGVDAYRSPSSEADRPVGLYLEGRSVEDVERERKEILSTKAADLAAVAKVLQTVLPQSRSFVVGGVAQVGILPFEKVESLYK